MTATLGYSVVRFVPDVARDEAVNLGVIVVDDACRHALAAFYPDVARRVRVFDPQVNVAVVASVLTRLESRARDASADGSPHFESAMIHTTEQLRVASASMRNQIQLSEPRSYNADSLEAAVAELYDLLVVPLDDKLTAAAPSPPPGGC